MPTYEYRCRECGHEFELFQSMLDDPIKDCPVCMGVVERLIGGGAGLLFKGSGFYITDYRSDSYTKAAKADKPPVTSSESSKKTSDSKKSGN